MNDNVNEHDEIMGVAEALITYMEQHDDVTAADIYDGIKNDAKVALLTEQNIKEKINRVLSVFKGIGIIQEPQGGVYAKTQF